MRRATPAFGRLVVVLPSLRVEVVVKRSPLRRKSKPKPKALPLEVKREVAQRCGYRCVGCRVRIPLAELAREIYYHHVLPKQRWPALALEPLNIVLVCVECHARHESGFRRLARAMLPLAAFDLARETGPRAESYLERTYV